MSFKFVATKDGVPQRVSYHDSLDEAKAARTAFVIRLVDDDWQESAANVAADTGEPFDEATYPEAWIVEYYEEAWRDGSGWYTWIEKVEE